MKRFLALILALTMALALAACGRAIGLEPENLDFRLPQVLVLKAARLVEQKKL